MFIHFKPWILPDKFRFITCFSYFFFARAAPPLGNTHRMSYGVINSCEIIISLLYNVPIIRLIVLYIFCTIIVGTNRWNNIILYYNNVAGTIILAVCHNSSLLSYVFFYYAPPDTEYCIIIVVVECQQWHRRQYETDYYIIIYNSNANIVKYASAKKYYFFNFSFIRFIITKKKNRQRWVRNNIMFVA